MASHIGRRKFLATFDETVCIALAEEIGLKLGRDVLGSGTETEPLRFRRGLMYHDAYYHYLTQKRIKVRGRRVHVFPEGPGDRVETEDGRVLPSQLSA